MNPQVTAIYVTYNSEDTIGDTLEAAQEAYEADVLRCIVVDNASGDATCDIVRERFPWVTLIESEENLGYGRGLNLGFQQVDTPYALYMNPDAVMGLSSVRVLHAFMENHPNAALAAPSIVRRNGEYQHAGGLLTPGEVIRRAGGCGGAPDPRVRHFSPEDIPFKTDWLCGAILFGRTKMMEELGGFDPRFFLYFEETDLCRRALDKGWELWAVGEAQARHASNSSARTVNAGLATGGCLTEHFFSSRFYYFAKHHGRAAAIAAESLELGLKGGRDLARWMLFKPGRGEFRCRLKAPIFTMPPEVRFQ